MKRYSNLYQEICSMDNLRLADQRARRGKRGQYGVSNHDKHSKANMDRLFVLLKEKTYKTSSYKTATIYEPKERIIYKLPYYPDRIVHHAVMNLLEPIFTSLFTADTYSCIKGKGILGLNNAIRRSLDTDMAGTTYYLKLDIQKFYGNIDHDILKGLLRRKFKDRDLLWLLDEIIDSADGVPIGNYLSQYFANFYFTQFDHWIKEQMGVIHYFRYADDIVIFSDSKPFLHELLAAIKEYLKANLKLTVKRNHRVTPTWCGVDVGGYKHFPRHTLLRPSIKKNFARAVFRKKSSHCIASYRGWAKHCNSKHLLKKLLNETV
ncbi:MAG: reverse transcriptase domain-containing protein [Sediminibacterium sp.]|nr:reverse transcriptase domain-containing protein [Sediminibacterium sp.]